MNSIASLKKSGTIFERFLTDAPGPGAYVTENHRSLSREGGFTIGSKYKKKDGSKAPGPMDYMAEQCLHKIKRQTSAQSIQLKSTPGVFNQIIRSSSKASAGDFDLSIPIIQQSHGQTIQQRYKQSKEIKSPGAADYDTISAKNHTMRLTSAQTMQKAVRDKKQIVEKAKIPAANQYNIDTNTLSRSGAGAFPKEKLKRQSTAAPGPADYEQAKFKNVRTRAQSASMSFRHSAGQTL
ncbi:SHIPPO_1-like protein [Hexamita inflata]|uniref:SHIPPO 1-like protein n=1 Tax=Hexamita inflata TaxID=28002 RepID=A0AA86Q3L8_9EUKA|nr:SHIPPO 1-like protein [Hexamita inflata]